MSSERHSKPLQSNFSAPLRKTSTARSARRPASDPDAELRKQILADLSRRDLTPKGDLRVEVQGRIVTVWGAVKSANDKEAVLRTVRQMPGILNVRDELTIDVSLKRDGRPKSPRSPVGIRAAIACGALCLVGIVVYFLLFGQQASPTLHAQVANAQSPISPAAVAVATGVDPSVESRPLRGATNAVARNSPVDVFPVTGRVTFRNRIPVGAFVVLHPLRSALPNQARPSGFVNADGSYTLSTYTRNDGAPAGEYAVTVEWRRHVGNGDSPITSNRLPARYQKPETSGLRVTIPQESSEVPSIQLGD